MSGTRSLRLGLCLSRFDDRRNVLAGRLRGGRLFQEPDVAHEGCKLLEIAVVGRRFACEQAV
ncbi:MAG: hypothetical protein M3R26_08020 [Actinomycetota bacterium]|nr:hypothetical protein [Actinomycetota bacterium]